MKYIVLSPDGLPITMHRRNYPSREAANAALAEWCKRFDQQGYYAAVTRQISLTDLPAACEIRQLNERVEQTIENIEGALALIDQAQSLWPRSSDLWKALGTHYECIDSELDAIKEGGYSDAGEAQ